MIWTLSIPHNICAENYMINNFVSFDPGEGSFIHNPLRFCLHRKNSRFNFKMLRLFLVAKLFKTESDFLKTDFKVYI